MRDFDYLYGHTYHRGVSSAWLLGVLLGIFLIKTFRRSESRSSLHQLGYLAIVLILAILISSDTFHTGLLRSSTEDVSQVLPLLPEQQDSFAEMTHQTNKKSILAAWWDYGSHINWFAKQGTVVDEDYYIPYWIYLMARHIFTTQSPKEALTFLYTHQATHLMITTEDILRLPVIAYTGSDNTFDRLATIYFLRPIAEQNVTPSMEKTNFTLHRNFLTKDTLELDGERFILY